MLVTRRRTVLAHMALAHMALATAAVGLAAAPAAAQTTDPGADHAHSPGATAAPAARRATAPREAYVYIGWPLDGANIASGRTKVWFGTRNFGVAPAGVAKQNTGHHHLLIDAPLPPLDREIPNDRNHLHFGLGQTETVIDLPPGTHTLQLIMGDENHVPHDPPVTSKRITVHVRGARPAPVADAR